MLREDLDIKQCLLQRIIGYQFDEDLQIFVIELEDGSELRIEEAAQSGALNIRVTE